MPCFTMTDLELYIAFCGEKNIQKRGQMLQVMQNRTIAQGGLVTDGKLYRWAWERGWFTVRAHDGDHWAVIYQ